MQIYVPPVVQGPPADSALRSPRADAEGPSPSAAAGSAALAPAGPSVSSVNPAAGSAAAATLQPPPPVYLRRPGPLCSDFRPELGGAGWSAVGPVEVPGPRGPVQLKAGQVVAPGDYLDGMDLGSVLQRDCPRTPIP